MVTDISLFDLHTHSTASDGQYSPTLLVELAYKSKLSAIAVSDHDSIDGVEEAVLAGMRLGVGVIPGIELSARDIDGLHILGYGISLSDPNLVAACDSFKQSRNERKYRIVDFLYSKNVKINVEEVELIAKDSVITRVHFARVIVNNGYAKTIKHAFELYLDTPEFSKIERLKPTFSECISIIRNAGGVSVLAHPKALKMSLLELDSFITKLVSSGIGGIECIYSTHTKAETELYTGFCKKNNLLITGGTDFHGEKIKPDINLGTGINGNVSFSDTELVNKLTSVSKMNNPKLFGL